MDAQRMSDLQQQQLQLQPEMKQLLENLTQAIEQAAKMEGKKNTQQAHEALLLKDRKDAQPERDKEHMKIEAQQAIQMKEMEKNDLKNAGCMWAHNL